MATKYFNVGEVREHLEKLYKQVQKWPPGQMRTDGNWLCSKLIVSLEESGRAMRENARLQKEIEALRKKQEKGE